MVVASFGANDVVRSKSEEKRIMLKKFLLFTIVGLVMLPALADKQPGKGNKGGGSVPLGVSFDETYFDESGEEIDYNFRSDGDVYIHGEPGVETGIDKFRFKVNVGLNGERNFILEGLECISDYCVISNPYVQGWNVFAYSPDGAQYLNMSADEPKLVTFQVGFFDTAGDYWNLKFNPDECPGTDMVTVTKTSDVTDTWEFKATEGEVACLYFREGPRKRHYFAGLYYVSFRITAVAIE
jgi:hypothetical protein